MKMGGTASISHDTSAQIARVPTSPETGCSMLGLRWTAPAIVTRTEGTWMGASSSPFPNAIARSGAGRALAKHVLFSHPGPLGTGPDGGQHRRICPFWRQVIGEITDGQDLTELQVTEGWWQGVVQQFNVPSAA